MTTTRMTPPLARIGSTEGDLLALTSKVRSQYASGLLTFDEFMTALAETRNGYCDDPASGVMIVDTDWGSAPHSIDCGCSHCDPDPEGRAWSARS